MDLFEKQSIYLKMLYFMLFIGIGAYIPFSSIYYKHILVHSDGRPALNYMQLIYFIMPLVGLFARFNAGIISDKLKIGRKVIIYSSAGGAFFSLLIAQSGEEWMASWSLAMRFFYIFSFLIFFTFCVQPIHAILDAETMILLNRNSKREKYGEFRLYGTFGWAFITLLMGFILQYTGRLNLMFYGTAFGYAAISLLSIFDIEVQSKSKPITIPWKHLRNDRQFLWFLLFSFIGGVVSNATFCYIGYFFDDVMNGFSEIGIIFCSWTLLEIPVMLYSRKLLEKFGNRWLIIVGMLLDIVRLLIFSSFTKDDPFIFKLATSFIHGPAFGLKFIGIIDFVDRQAHKNMRATYMSIMNIAQMSIAASVGGVIGGWIMISFGGAMLMQFCAFINVGLIVFFIIFVRGHKPINKNQ